MKSPYTGKEMTHQFKPATWRFRGEQFPYIRESWKCEDTGEEFTTTESDTAGYMQVTNQYRAAHGIPFTDEIVALRKRYGLSINKMSQVLGIGVNQYRSYENGEVPSESNGKLIRSAFNPKALRDMLCSSQELVREADYVNLLNKINQIIETSGPHKMEQYEMVRLFQVPRGSENGFAPISMGRLKNLLLYILERCDHVWTTKMNKLLFYIDFTAYRSRGMAISGLPNRAMEYGPVPERWDRVYSQFDEITQVPTSVKDSVGTILHASEKADMSEFTDEEITVIDAACRALGKMSASRLSTLSHNESAWINHSTDHSRIPFQEAFALKENF